MGLKGQITPSRIILAVLLAATAAAMIFSGRPWRGYNMPRVAEIAVLPDTPQTAPIRRYTEIGSGIFPYIGGPRPELRGRRTPLRLGYAYDEVGILGMPYRVTGTYGMVTYFENEQGVQLGAITPGQIPLLDAAIGSPVASSYQFRWYLQIWGWFFPLLFGLWILAWRREDKMEEQRLLES
jgi:hypothetical protein